MRPYQKKRFKIRLKTLTPVHIGSGESFSQDSFVIDRKEKLLYEFNPLNLLEALPEEAKKEFEAVSYLESYKLPIALMRFYQKYIEILKKISLSAIPVPEDLIEVYERVLNLENLKDLLTTFNAMKIERTSLHIHSGHPFIPGSSLKGALRTGYINWLAQQKFGAGESAPSEVLKNPKKNYSLLEAWILNSLDPSGTKFDVISDPFKYLQISDLSPVEEVKTCILFKLNVKPVRNQSGFNLHVRIPQLLEVIPEGTYFEGHLDFIESPRHIAKAKTFRFDDLISGARVFYEPLLKKEGRYHQNWSEISDFLKNLKREEINNCKNKRALILKLGRHSGREAVTLKGLKWSASEPKTFWVVSESKNALKKASLLGWVYLEFLEH